MWLLKQGHDEGSRAAIPSMQFWPLQPRLVENPFFLGTLQPYCYLALWLMHPALLPTAPLRGQLAEARRQGSTLACGKLHQMISLLSMVSGSVGRGGALWALGRSTALGLFLLLLYLGTALAQAGLPAASYAPCGPSLGESA